VGQNPRTSRNIGRTPFIVLMYPTGGARACKTIELPISGACEEEEGQRCSIGDLVESPEAEDPIEVQNLIVSFICQLAMFSTEFEYSLGIQIQL